MFDLADKVIQANEDADTPAVEEEQKVDDIGFPLPKPNTEKAWCEYLTARLLYLNPRMYKYEGFLWLGNDIVKENKNTYYRLAKYPKNISDPECQYIWRKAKELVPVLDPDIIAILPNMTFNMKTGAVKFEEVWTTTPWDEEE